MLELLAISQDPKALVPFVTKCFPGIVNLKFVLPANVSSTIRTQLDAALNGIISPFHFLLKYRRSYVFLSK